MPWKVLVWVSFYCIYIYIYFSQLLFWSKEWPTGLKVRETEPDRGKAWLFAQPGHDVFFLGGKWGVGDFLRLQQNVGMIQNGLEIWLLKINISDLIFPNVRFFGLEMMPKTVFEKCWDYPTNGRCANLTIGYHERMMNCTQLVLNTQ